MTGEVQTGVNRVSTRRLRRTKNGKSRNLFPDPPLDWFRDITDTVRRLDAERQTERGVTWC